MKKRALELIAVLVVVAAAVGFTRSARSTAEVSPPAPSTPSLSASPIGVAAPVQTQQATLLWKSLYDEAHAVLGQGDNDRAEDTLVSALKLAPMATPDALH